MTTPDEHRRNAIAEAAEAIRAVMDPDNLRVTLNTEIDEYATAAYDAMEPLIRQAVAEEIAHIAEQWAANTIDMRAAPAFSDMADAARIVGKRATT